MDKRVMLAVAGAGKTTHIIDSLSAEKRSLIVTYTNANYHNLQKKINEKYNYNWPENVVLMRYFPFLYNFCFKPFLSDIVNAKGITFKPNPNQYANHIRPEYYMNHERYLYSNRISQLIEVQKVVDLVKNRIQTYFDEFIIDEVQDIAGRDFNLLKTLMTTNVNMLFVGDFYQHTFDTSRDGSVNNSLFSDISKYKDIFSKNGFTVDTQTLSNSWRCSKSLCSYISDNLNIIINSNRSAGDDTFISYVEDSSTIKNIIKDKNIIKLHYQNAANYGSDHKNWGETKGEDDYTDVCILLNQTSFKKFKEQQLHTLPPQTKNKLYVALTRARGNVYIVEEALAKKLL